MKAIILAAGLGSRLGPKSDGRPKALQRVGGRSLITHQLEALSAEGVGPVIVVVGHGAEQIRENLGDSVEYVVNERPGETNSLYSLWLAQEWLEGDVLLLNCDVLFHPDVLKRLLRAKGSALAFDSTSQSGAEQTKVGLRGKHVSDLGKDFPETGARGENLGMIKLDPEGSSILRKRVNAIIETGNEKIWVTEAVRSILAEVDVEGVNMAGLPWVEIDFPYDLDQARRLVWPAIRRSMTPSGRVWRKARLPLAVGGALGIATLAVALPAQVGPASVDWESLEPEQVGLVRIEREGKGPQKWWPLTVGQHLTVDVDGNAPVRLEARPLIESGMAEKVSYALEVTLDGEPYLYESNGSSVDHAVRYPGFVVGKRDRHALDLPSGRHRLGVRFLAGQVDRLLVRVRQPE